VDESTIDTRQITNPDLLDTDWKYIDRVGFDHAASRIIRLSVTTPFDICVHSLWVITQLGERPEIGVRNPSHTVLPVYLVYPVAYAAPDREMDSEMQSSRRTTVLSSTSYEWRASW
jgi:hypothetical protein